MSDPLKGRKRPSVPFRLLAVEDEQLVAAQVKLAEAEQRLRQATIRADASKPERGKELAAAKRAHSRAHTAMLACWTVIRLTALPPHVYEQLKAAHPPTPEQLKADPEAEWNRESLRPALLAVCADGGRSVEEWAHLLAENFSSGERHEIFTTALAINESSRVVESVVLPKGSTGMNNSLLNLR